MLRPEGHLIVKFLEGCHCSTLLHQVLRASSVAKMPMNTDFNARLNGLDPKSPYVTQRANQGYTWYNISHVYLCSYIYTCVYIYICIDICMYV